MLNALKSHRLFAIRALLIALITTGAMVQAASAAEPDFPIKHANLNDDHVALQGYDPVAYFESKSAVKGNDRFTETYKGIVYHFASADHQKLFKDAPVKYLPTYGGWCATAMSRGEKVDIDPTNFKLTNGRLFLFYKGWLGDAKKDWDKDEAKMTAQADAAWKKLVNQ